MRLLSLLSALTACACAGPVLSQTAAPEVSIVVVTLDQARQIQVRHGHRTLAALADERGGQFHWAEAKLGAETFESCLDERSGRGLDYCVRYSLTRADLPADAPPTVVVVFDDRPAADRQRGGEMSVTCFGRAVAPVDAAAQETWLWPDSVRVHGVNDWNRDREALAACITAAASERWTGPRQPA